LRIELSAVSKLLPLLSETRVSVRVLGDTLHEFNRACELTNARQVTTGINRHSVLLIPPQANCVEILQPETRWIEQSMAAGTLLVVAVSRETLTPRFTRMVFRGLDRCSKRFGG